MEEESKIRLERIERIDVNVSSYARGQKEIMHNWVYIPKQSPR